jgi:hypothetical protein
LEEAKIAALRIAYELRDALQPIIEEPHDEVAF